MNGNCSGGTAAFIDLMAVILGEDIDSLSILAEKSTKIYPIASRCGVFCNTDIQNLIDRGVEIVPPMLTDFFTQFFVNRKVKKASLSENSRIPDWIYNYLYRLYKKHVSYFNKAEGVVPSAEFVVFGL